MKRHRFTILVTVASVSVAFIIALQIFWLFRQFDEQHDRFYADIENAISETSILQMVSKSVARSRMNTDDKSGDTVVMALSAILREAKKFDVDVSTNIDMQKTLDSVTQTAKKNGVNNAVQVNTSATDSNISREIQKALDSAAQKRPDKKSKIYYIEDTASATAADIKGYQDIMRTALERRKIYVKPELAIVAPSGRIVAATTDSATFVSSPVKSSGSSRVKLPIDDKGDMLQAAFPDAGMYLLQQMAWLLVLSVVFITLFILSFIYLLSSFFREKKLSAIKTDFVNNMTHELKTPISSMSVALELVQDKDSVLGADIKDEYLQIARGELQRLSVLVEKVLNIAAFEKKEVRINPEKIVIKALLDTVVNSFRPVLERRHAQVSVKATPELLVMTADKMHFSNVIQNLLDNALKYNDKEQPQIDITATEEKGNIVIRVKDNGKGIPKAYLEKVFDNFFRIPLGDVHDVKGYGIGLSYVKAVAHLHEGNVIAESTEGQGSTFIITIPKK